MLIFRSLDIKIEMKKMFIKIYSRWTENLGREHFDLKIGANEIDFKEAERFNCFPSAIFNCTIKILLL